MAIYPLVFSNNPNFRLSRHILFWTGWIIYYTIATFLSFKGARPTHIFIIDSFLEVLAETPLDMVYCYLIIYYLLPVFLFKGRYVTMIFLWLLFSVLYIPVFIANARYIVTPIRHYFSVPPLVLPSSYLWIFFNLFSQINMEGGLAAAIKLGKLWYIKSEELNLLKKQKDRIIPDFEAGKVQPFFLLNALDKVELSAKFNASIVPKMIKKIKKLLMYITYDHNQLKVPLKDELSLLEEFVELERLGMQENLLISLKNSCNGTDEKVAPFIILSLAEFCFRQLSRLEIIDKAICIENTLQDKLFCIKISWSKPLDTSTLTDGNNAFLDNLSRRLKLLYPGSHEFTATILPETFIIEMRLNLNNPVS